MLHALAAIVIALLLWGLKAIAGHLLVHFGVKAAKKHLPKKSEIPGTKED